MAKEALGKGLGALFGEKATIEAPPITVSGADQGVMQIDLRKVEPNRGQPRQYFDEDRLEELAESIRAHGIIQPLIVKDCGTYYSIIAGERRFRAARRAGLKTVPAIVKEHTELEILQIALIENIQRQDLTPIEEAACYRRLMDDFFFTQEDLGQKVGKNRAAISNAIRLLDLDPRVQDLLAANRITASHARVLLAVKDADTQFETAERVAEEDLSVRGAETLVTALLAGAPPPKAAPPKTDPVTAAAYRQAEAELQTLLGTKVSIRQGKGKSRGKIEIEYYSADELDRMLGLLRASGRAAPKM